MTQGITDTQNNSLYTMLQQQDTTGASKNTTSDSYMSALESFTSIIEKNQQKLEKTPLTIGDLKTLKNSSAETPADFKAFLQKETQTASDENALDLTLAEDIKNFIAQLQEQNITTENLTDIQQNTETTANISLENDAAEESTSIQEFVEEIVDTVTTALYTEDSTNTSIMDKLANLENTALENASLISLEGDLSQVNSLLEDNTVISNLTNKLSETFSKIVTDNTTKIAKDPTVNEPEISDEMINDLNIESIDAQAETASQEGFDLQQQTPEEHAIKAMITTDINTDFESNLQETQETPDMNNKNLHEVSTGKIIEQVTKQLNGINSNSKVDIVLNPERLGKVSIHVAKSPEGMSAQFTVSTNEAKEILQKNLDGLKESLLSHGISTDNVSVKMNETQKSEYKEDWTEQNNSNNKNREQQQQQKEEKDKNIFEKMMAFINTNESENA